MCLFTIFGANSISKNKHTSCICYQIHYISPESLISFFILTLDKLEKIWHGRMDTRICMAESLCCPSETIATSLISPRQYRMKQKTCLVLVFNSSNNIFLKHYLQTRDLTNLPILQPVCVYWMWPLSFQVCMLTRSWMTLDEEKRATNKIQQ